MDPLSIAASSLSVAGGIAKTIIAVVEFAREAKAAADDLQTITRELQALSSILEPLTRGVSRAAQGTVSAPLAQQLTSSLEGCELVVGQIETTVEKYQRDGEWTRTKWVMFGRGDIVKLRDSLEAYKIALSLGLHVISIATEESIKQDTSTLRNNTRVLQQYATAIKVNTEEILARVNSIRHDNGNINTTRVEQWMDEITILTSYAETTYQETVIDPGEVRDMGPEEAGFAALNYRRNPDSDGGVVLEEHYSLGRLSLREESEEDEGPRVDPGLTPASLSQSSNTGSSGGVVSDKHPTVGTRSENHEERLGGTEADLVGKLDLLVAIDIGHTSAAVAWMTQANPIQVIQDWPGGEGTRVPTQVVYDRDQNLSSWGFLCAGDTGPGKVWHSCPWLGNFKSSNLTSMDSIPGHLRLIDFLDQLYLHIMKSISSSLGIDPQDWTALGIEFHFILPDKFYFYDHSFTTSIMVHTLRTIELSCQEIKKTLRKTGFGTKAAATAILEQHATAIQSSRTLLVNLGHTYAVILQANCTNTKYFPDGVEAATQVIDRYKMSLVSLPRFSDLFVEHVQKRFREYPEVVAQSGIDLELLKHNMGFLDISNILNGSTVQQDHHRFPINGISKSFKNEPLNIEDGMMGFTEEDIRLILDRLVQQYRDIIIGSYTPSRIYRNIQVIMMQTTEARGYLTNRVQNAMRDAFKVTPALPTQLKQKDLSAVEGILLCRNPWNKGARRRIWCQSNLHHSVHVLCYRQQKCHPNLLEPPSKKFNLSPYAPVEQRWGINVADDDDDILLTFDICDDSRQQICQVVWVVKQGYRHQKGKRRWYGIRRTVRYLEFNLVLFVANSLKVMAVPQFEMRLSNPPNTVIYPKSVT